MKLENILIFIASLIISILLWLQIQPLNDPSRERELQVRLEIRDLPDALVLLQPPESVTVVASGTKEQLDQLQSDSVMAYIDLSAAQIGERNYTVQVQGPLNSGVKFNVKRSLLQLTVEKLVEDQRVVTLETTGLPPNDLVYDGATIQPDVVTIEGPESRVAAVHSVRAIFDLGRAAPRSDFTVEVEPLDKDGKPLPQVICIPSSVTISPAVAAAPPSRRIWISPTIVGQPAFGFRIVRTEVRPQQVELSGQAGVLQRVTSVETDPIDVEGINETRTVSAKLRVPDGLSATTSQEIQVTIYVEADRPPADPPRPSTTGGEDG